MTNVGDVLVELGKISRDDLDRAAKVPRAVGDPIDAVLVQLGMVSGRDRAEAMARLHGLPIARAEDFPPLPLVPDALAPRFLRQAQVVPLWQRGDELALAMADPGAEYAIDAVRVATQMNVVPYVAAAEDIDAAIERYFGTGKSAIDRILEDIDERAEDGAEEDIEQLKDLAREAPVVRLVNQLVTDALHARASDIHVEPFRNELRIRYRIDGVLREVQSPPASLSKALVSRIKIIARLNIAERRLPQDGRARFAVQGRQIDLRVATMPSIHGESVVIRLLDDRGRTLDFSSLGLAPEAEETLRKCLVMPNGMVLVTGPTGSGKTTLLYAALDLLNIPDRKILTVEDPIEYQIPGINQTQVKPDIGLGFANVLRNIVRHDPEIIMVGEMRDRETAQMAVHAALTGHLVLTTLHTNTAAGAITRLIDMEIEPFLLTSTIRAMVAQRLVRVLCPDCREPYPAPIEFAELAEQRGLHVGSNASLYKPVGCEECGGIGYLGRIGIFELVTMTQNLRDAVRVGVGTSELHQVARRDGFVTMFEDGLRKCLSGVTTIDEIGRVIEDW